MRRLAPARIHPASLSFPPTIQRLGDCSGPLRHKEAFPILPLANEKCRASGRRVAHIVHQKAQGLRPPAAPAPSSPPTDAKRRPSGPQYAARSGPARYPAGFAPQRPGQPRSLRKAHGRGAALRPSGHPQPRCCPSPPYGAARPRWSSPLAPNCICAVRAPVSPRSATTSEAGQALQPETLENSGSSLFAPGARA
jgi:hypothetical protein